jgi:hypothetical protein
MKNILLPIAIFAAWNVLNRWVLPWFGIQTCMSGACAQLPRAHSARQQETENPTKPIGEEETRSHGMND